VKHKLAVSFLPEKQEEKNAFRQLCVLDMLQNGHIILHRSLDAQAFALHKLERSLQLRQASDDRLHLTKLCSGTPSIQQ
jgi:hypothetical protein